MNHFRSRSFVCVNCNTKSSQSKTISTFLYSYSAFVSFSFRKLSGKSSKDSTGAKSTESCSICHKTSASTSNAESLLPLTVCGNCSASICQNTSCAIRLDGGNVWKCNVCHHRQQLNASANFLQSYDWIFERLNQKFSERANANAKEQTEARTRRCCSNVMLDSNGKFAQSVSHPRTHTHILHLVFPVGEPVIVPPPLQERIRVREFIEDLLSSMLGGSLDDVCVGRIYENIDCEYTHRRCLHSGRFSLYSGSFIQPSSFDADIQFSFIFISHRNPTHSDWQIIDFKLFARFHGDLSRIVYRLEISLHQSFSGESLSYLFGAEFVFLTGNFGNGIYC